MAGLLIDIDDAMRARLRSQAAEHGRTEEQEAAEMLRKMLEADRPLNPAEIIRKYMDPLGGIELQPLPRDPVRRPPDLSEQ